MVGISTKDKVPQQRVLIFTRVKLSLLLTNTLFLIFLLKTVLIFPTELSDEQVLSKLDSKTKKQIKQDAVVQFNATAVSTLKDKLARLNARLDKMTGKPTFGMCVCGFV